MQPGRIKPILLLLCCCIIAVLAAHFLRFSPAPVRPEVSFLGFRNTGSGVLAHFTISNASTRPVEYNLCPAQVTTNGYSAHPVPPTGPATLILSGQSAVVFVSPPESQGTWRVPIEWYQLPTRGDVLWYRIKHRFELFLQVFVRGPQPLPPRSSTRKR